MQHYHAIYGQGEDVFGRYFDARDLDHAFEQAADATEAGEGLLTVVPTGTYVADPEEGTMQKIYLETLADDLDAHFVARFNRPGRIEVTMEDGHLVAHLYEGSTTHPEQEPLGAYDSAVQNESWGR